MRQCDGSCIYLLWGLPWAHQCVWVADPPLLGEGGNTTPLAVLGCRETQWSMRSNLWALGLGHSCFYLKACEIGWPSTLQHLLTSREVSGRSLTVPAPLLWLWSFPGMKAALRPLLPTPQKVRGSGFGQKGSFPPGKERRGVLKGLGPVIGSLSPFSIPPLVVLET